ELSPRRARLVPAVLHEFDVPVAVQSCEPLFRIRHHRLEKHTLGNVADAHPVALETELAREPDGLAAAVAKQFGKLRLRHPGPPIGIYHGYRPRARATGSAAGPALRPADCGRLLVLLTALHQLAN